MQPSEFISEMGEFKVIFRKLLSSRSLKDFNLSDRQTIALQFVTENERITTQEYKAKFGITERQARHDLSEMVKNQLLARVGRTTGSYYRLSEDFRRQDTFLGSRRFGARPTVFRV